MNTHYIKLASIGALSGAVINLVSAYRSKRAADEIVESNTMLHDINDVLMAECTKLNDKLKAADERELYLREMLDAHGVPVSEFDLLVINSITK